MSIMDTLICVFWVTAGVAVVFLVLWFLKSKKKESSVSEKAQFGESRFGEKEAGQDEREGGEEEKKSGGE